jgi:hypothetical protein
MRPPPTALIFIIICSLGAIDYEILPHTRFLRLVVNCSKAAQLVGTEERTSRANGQALELGLLGDGPGVALGEPVAGGRDQLVRRLGASAAKLVQLGLDLIDKRAARTT